jgi:alpha-methylacyl-CoA racemase
MADDSVRGPLSGVRVLDLTRFPPGAYCTLLLADLGAHVYRVDAPGAIPMAGGVGVSLSRGKRSVGLDLRHPRGNEVLRRLSGWADVLVENNRPGDMEKRGFGYPQAAAEHPRLVWCSITGFGQDGPYATRPGHDLTYTAHSGLLAAINPELPWHPQTVLAVPLGAMMAATGIASALLERERSGRGCQIDISLAEAATWLLSGTDGELAGSPWGIPVTPDRRLYECGDGRFITVAAAEPRTWAALCEGLGLADLAGSRPTADQAEDVTARLAPRSGWTCSGHSVPPSAPSTAARTSCTIRRSPPAAAWWRSPASPCPGTPSGSATPAGRGPRRRRHRHRRSGVTRTRCWPPPATPRTRWRRSGTRERSSADPAPPDPGEAIRPAG